MEVLQLKWTDWMVKNCNTKRSHRIHYRLKMSHRQWWQPTQSYLLHIFPKGMKYIEKVYWWFHFEWWWSICNLIAQLLGKPNSISLRGVAEIQWQPSICPLRLNRCAYRNGSTYIHQSTNRKGHLTSTITHDADTFHAHFGTLDLFEGFNRHEVKTLQNLNACYPRYMNWLIEFQLLFEFWKHLENG